MTPNRRLPVLVPCLILVLCAGAAPRAQNRVLQQRLAEAKSVTCTFATMATAAWTDGVASAAVVPSKRTVSFTNVNLDEGTADSASDFGDSFIVVRYSGDYLHLMQTHGSGQLYTTTVLARETKEGRLMAVHTRHEYTDVRLPGYTSRPEMYVGDCAVTK